MRKTDPFTRTPGKAGDAFINMHYSEKVIDSFVDENSYKYVYKITGLRGSGKSVEYSRIINEMKTRDKWLVYTLSSAGNPINTLISKLSREKFIKLKNRTKSVSSAISAGGSILAARGDIQTGVTTITAENPNFYSDEAALTEMVQRANDKGYKILVGIDDISKTPEMVRFLSIWGAMLLDDDKKIYLICTGLSKNIEDFSKENNLTFFKRSDVIEIKALDRYEIADKYRKLLGIDQEEAVNLSKFVKGYAYAFQIMGSLYFNKTQDEVLEDLIPEFEKCMFRDSYELIWKSLTDAEKTFVKQILITSSGKAADIKAKMEKPANYAVLRERLYKKHLIDISERGIIKIELPRFREFVTMWE